MDGKVNFRGRLGEFLFKFMAWMQTSALMSSRSEKGWNDHFSQDCVTERSQFLVVRDGKGPRCDVTEQTERRNWSQALSVTCWPPDNVLAQPTIERLSIAFTANSKREFVARDQVSPLLVVYCTLGTLRACLHGGGEPQVGEVTCLCGVKK